MFRANVLGHQGKSLLQSASGLSWPLFWDMMAARCNRMDSCVLQRGVVSVEVDGKIISEVGAGFLILICAIAGDDESGADQLVSKICKLRVFGDENGKMNRSLLDIGGSALVVSQFVWPQICHAATGRVFLCCQARRWQTALRIFATPSKGVPLATGLRSKYESAFTERWTGDILVDTEQHRRQGTNKGTKYVLIWIRTDGRNGNQSSLKSYSNLTVTGLWLGLCLRPLERQRNQRRRRP